MPFNNWHKLKLTNETNDQHALWNLQNLILQAKTDRID